MASPRSTPAEVLAFAAELSTNSKMLLMLQAAYSDCQCHPCQILRSQGRALATASARAHDKLSNGGAESPGSGPGAPGVDGETRPLTEADLEEIKLALAAWRRGSPGKE